MLGERLRQVIWTMAVCAPVSLAATAAVADDSPARPLHICIISGPHYKADESLAEFQKHLEANYHVKISPVLTIEYPNGKDLPGIEALDTADCLIVYTRRITVPADQLERVKKYCAGGKPVIGIRTASHAFQNWSQFSRDVLGAKFGPHFNNAPMKLETLEKTSNHPILTGVKPFPTDLGLYQYTDFAPDVQVLLTGTVKDKEPEAVAWAREVNGGRVFYTSLGGTSDFKDENFKQMLVNAISWTIRKELTKLKK